MTLSSDQVLSTLQANFVSGWRNIQGEEYCGRSGQHPTDTAAVYTTNGAGPHNTQLFMLAADGTVLHCLPGFWSPEDFLTEAAFAKDLNGVWQNPSLSRAEKDKLFTSMHKQHVQKHSQDMVNRSVMQGFDKKFEERRSLISDCILRSDDAQPAHRPIRGKDEFKTTDQILHDRLAKTPFVPYERFDVAAFADYGRALYDKKQDGIPRPMKAKK
ncbi:MAG: hypothetical protein HYZ53_16920 [Planctomycetes bacterium]|nr:hypothetical protein [Planctomycetota bacterium]